MVVCASPKSLAELGFETISSERGMKKTYYQVDTENNVFEKGQFIVSVLTAIEQMKQTAKGCFRGLDRA